MGAWVYFEIETVVFFDRRRVMFGLADLAGMLIDFHTNDNCRDERGLVA